MENKFLISLDGRKQDLYFTPPGSSCNRFPKSWDKRSQPMTRSFCIRTGLLITLVQKAMNIGYDESSNCLAGHHSPLIKIYQSLHATKQIFFASYSSILLYSSSGTTTTASRDSISSDDLVESLWRTNSEDQMTSRVLKLKTATLYLH